MTPRTMSTWARLTRVVLALTFFFTTASIAKVALARVATEGANQGHDRGNVAAAAKAREPAEEGAEQGHAEQGGAHAHAGHGPADMNWTDLSDKERPAYIALLVNFGIMAALYYTLGKKPITEGLKQRRLSIGKDIEEAREMLAEAKERAKKYQADLKNADTDAATTKTTLVAAGKGEVERLLLESEERGERMKRDAERLVEQEKKQVAYDLHIETVNLAMVQAQKLLEKSATMEDHARLANELLAELQRKPAAARSIAPRAGGAS